MQPADDFDSGGFASLRPPRKPNDNDYVLENVRPGRYWLKVTPYRGYVASAVAGSADLLRQPLVVGPGGASLPIEIVLRDDGAAIDGTVEGMHPEAADRRSPILAMRSGPIACLQVRTSIASRCRILPAVSRRVGSRRRGPFSCSKFLRAPIAFSLSTARQPSLNIRILKS